MLKNKFLGTLILLGTLIPLAFAVPPGFNVQGRLTDSAGINRDGVFIIRFTVFDSFIGGRSIWSKDYSVNVKSGNFQVTLEDPDASGRKLLSMVNSAAPSLEFQVISGPGISGQEPALVPRQRLVSVPFALKSQTVEQGGVPVGSIMPYGGTTPPSGWLMCNGDNISRAAYAELFSVIGTNFGAGDGTTFALPDLRGRFLRGVDPVEGRDPDASTRAPMSSGGNAGNLVGSIQEDSLQGHWHTMYRTDTGWGIGIGGGGGYGGMGPYRDGTNLVAASVITGQHGTPKVSFETRPKNAYVNYIIKH